MPAPSFHRITSGARLIGFVAIDSIVAGRARGGLRISEDVGEDEIRAAARAMTLKYGHLGLPQGGAKAGIVGDAEAPVEERRRMLAEFARAAEPLLRSRAYIPDADIGTSTEEIRRMMESGGFRVGPREWRASRSGVHTARSCAAAADVLVERLGTSWTECRVAIEGFGKVGSPLARLVSHRGARVVAISTSRGALYREGGLDVAALGRGGAPFGESSASADGERLERGALLELPVDLLFPCARYHSIHRGNAARVRARAICAGANDPVSPEAERLLLDRGVLYPPDFVTNCGGVLGGTLEFAGVADERIGRFVEDRTGRRVRELFDRAERLGGTLRSVAESDAIARHAAVRARAEHPTVGQRLVSLGIEAYRRAWIPRKLVSIVATRYLDRQTA